MRGLRIFTVTAILAIAVPARASLTTSETEQVRRAVATATEVARVRALVARPDLHADEAAAVLSSAMATTPFDAAHGAYLHELVFSPPSTASRPALAPATLRSLLARADALLQQHALDLDRTPAALGELARIYAFVEDLASAGPDANITAPARADCARALIDHIGRSAAILAPQSSVAAPVARARAQAALAVLDFMPDGATRRIDAANALALTGARRALAVERGLLVLDAGAPDGAIEGLRGLLDRLAGAREGVEGLWAGTVGDPSWPDVRARDGAVVGVRVDPPYVAGAAGTTLLWGGDVQSPPGDGWTTAVARGLAKAAVARAVVQDSKSDLRAQVTRDGVDGVAAMAAVLAIDGPLAVEVAATRLLASRRESVACLADAIGALAAFAPPGKVADGMTLPIGPARSATTAPHPPAALTHVILGPGGSAGSFRLEGHTWLFERDTSGVVTGLRRDGLRVTTPMLKSVKG